MIICKSLKALIYDGTGSIYASTGCYLVVLGQYGAVLIGICWYWVGMGRGLGLVSMGRCWYVLDGIGSVQLGTASLAVLGIKWYWGQ